MLHLFLTKYEKLIIVLFLIGLVIFGFVFVTSDFILTRSQDNITTLLLTREVCLFIISIIIIYERLKLTAKDTKEKNKFKYWFNNLFLFIYCMTIMWLFIIVDILCLYKVL